MSIAQHGETSHSSTHTAPWEPLLNAPNPFKQVEPYTITVRAGSGEEVTVSFDDLDWTYSTVPVQIRHQGHSDTFDMKHLLEQAAMSLMLWTGHSDRWAPELRPAGGAS